MASSYVTIAYSGDFIGIITPIIYDKLNILPSYKDTISVVTCMYNLDFPQDSPLVWKDTFSVLFNGTVEYIITIKNFNVLGDNLKASFKAVAIYTSDNISQNGVPATLDFYIIEILE